MLSVYTRHSQTCEHRDDINWRRCRCPKWIQGVSADGRGPIRITARTRSWERAEAKAREMDEAADPHKPLTRPAITIAEAVSSYRADENGELQALRQFNSVTDSFRNVREHPCHLFGGTDVPS